MNWQILACVVLLAAPLAAGNGQWVLATSTLTYRVSHSSGEMEGVSHAAKGRGACWNGQCNFRIEVLVKSFESGDPGGDLQIIQETHGAQFPMVTILVSWREPAMSGAGFRGDVDIEFAGRTAKYRDVAFETSATGVGTRITGTIPARLADFQIESPSLVKNEMPIRVDMTWRPGI